MHGLLIASIAAAITLAGAATTDGIKSPSNASVRTNEIHQTQRPAADTAKARPVVLQPLPDTALDCRIDSQRRFEPRRRAFVMKKVMVCE